MSGLLSFRDGMKNHEKSLHLLSDQKAKGDIWHNIKVAHGLPGCFLSKILCSTEITGEPVG